MMWEELNGRSRRSTLSLSFALCVAVFVQTAAAEIPYYFGQSADSTPVALSIRDASQTIVLSIPRKYLDFSPNWHGGPQDVISMNVVFPAMLPLSGTGKSLADRDVLSIALYSHASNGAHYTVADLIKRKVATEWTFVRHQGADFDVYAYTDEIKRWSDPTRLIHEYWVPTSQDTHSEIYFQCYRETGNPRVGCSAHRTFEQELELVVTFRQNDISQWREIMTAVEGLLRSFGRSE